MTSYLSQHGFVDCCEVSGETDDVHLYLIGNMFYFLNPENFQTYSNASNQEEQVHQNTSENIVGGIVGGLLGSLLGVLAIVLIGQLGYISTIGGFVMGFAVIFGYEKLGKKFSKKAAVICLIIVLAMTYFAHQLSYGIAVANYYQVSIFETLPYINQLVDEGYIDQTIYHTDLILLFIFTLIAAAYMIFKALKQHSRRFAIQKLI